MSTLIDPRRPTPQAAQDFTTEPVWLRNPQTGIIFGLTHIDTIKRCQSENYLPSSREAMLEQAIELADFHGKPRPAWAPPRDGETPPEPTPEPAPDPGDEPDASVTFHERNRRAALRK